MYEKSPSVVLSFHFPDKVCRISAKTPSVQFWIVTSKNCKTHTIVYIYNIYNIYISHIYFFDRTLKERSE